MKMFQNACLLTKCLCMKMSDFKEKACDERTRLVSARNRAILSILINLGLASVKAYAGLISHSKALLSDAVHSATDVVASMATFLGIWAANKKHPAFPYGLYKAETLATLISSVAILIAGYKIAKSAIFGPVTCPDVASALPIAIFSLIVSLAFGICQLRAGKSLGRPALVADGRDYLTDSLSTLVVIAGLAAHYFGYHLDRIAAVAVSLFVFRAGGLLFWSALKELLDAAIDRETEREIIGFVESHPLVTRVKKVLSRGAGGRIIIDMDVAMKTTSHQVADHVADKLEEEITAKYPQVIIARVRPHFEPSERVVRVVAVESPGGPVSAHLAGAPWFRVEVIDAKSGKVLERRYLENPYSTVERRKGFLVGKWLLSLRPDEVIAGSRHEGTAEAMLEEAGVAIRTDTKVDG